jgi:hypothetical protein
MSADTNERSLKDTEEEMAEEADGMERRLEELGEHADAARKKAQVTREQAGPDAEEPRDGEDA